MPFIKVQKLVKSEDGSVVSGSASIVDTFYVKDAKYHAKHSVRERLGKIISIDDDHKHGIFLSPTRGLVEYDATSDSFTSLDKNDHRISDSNLFHEPTIHIVFGDSYLLLKFLEKYGLIDILRTVFQKKTDYERLMCHILHGVLKDGSKITCEDFIGKSFASYLFNDIPFHSLKSDTQFFAMMGNDETKVAFFKAFVEMTRKKEPSFGRGCYVDSTPLPNDIIDNPFNALCSHGLTSTSIQTRLVLILDEKTGLPVWYDIIPGNVLDINTLMNVTNDVAITLGIIIDSYTLDAGYINEELIHAIHIGTEKTMIGRMSARKGYPHKEQYWKVKPMLGKGKYMFVRNNHTYFGKREEVTIFGEKEYAYIYVDQYNACKKFRDYLLEHKEEYDEMKERDQDWMTIKFGFFILVSNVKKEPDELLTDYFGRTEIETVFKTSKEYLQLLPLSKWTDQTIRGKILHDIINTIIFLLLRKQIDSAGISTTELFGKTQSLMCMLDQKTGQVLIETPSKKVKEYYKILGITPPSNIVLSTFKGDVILL